MRFDGFHHIGLFTANTQRSLKFYTEGLGGKVTFSFPLPGDDSKTIYLVELGDNAVVEIIPRGVEEEEKNSRWAHICLATEDVRGAFELALAAGAKVRSNPNDVALGIMKATNAFVYGPDEEVIEFFHVRGMN